MGRTSQVPGYATAASWWPRCEDMAFIEPDVSVTYTTVPA